MLTQNHKQHWCHFRTKEGLKILENIHYLVLYCCANIKVISKVFPPHKSKEMSHTKYYFSKKHFSIRLLYIMLPVGKSLFLETKVYLFLHKLHIGEICRSNSVKVDVLCTKPFLPSVPLYRFPATCLFKTSLKGLLYKSQTRKD